MQELKKTMVGDVQRLQDTLSGGNDSMSRFASNAERFIADGKDEVKRHFVQQKAENQRAALRILDPPIF